MTTTTGDSGTVKSGANDVAEIRSFTVTETSDTTEDTAMGDTYRTRKPTKKDWSGSLSCWWDADDTNGQVTLSAGAEVTLHLHPEGDASGDVDITGSAIITEYTVNSDQEGIVEATFNFVGNGALTRTTVS